MTDTPLSLLLAIVIMGLPLLALLALLRGPHA
jgi:hypothetical protein